MTREELNEKKTPSATPAATPKATRKVVKKQLFVCRGVDNEDPGKAARFEVVAGPCKDTYAAFVLVRDTLPDGKYVLMHEGKTVTKKSETVSKVEM